MKEELKQKMIGVIGTHSNALIESIAEKCAQVAIDYYKERDQALSMSGVRGRIAILYSYWDDKNYEVEIPEDTDLDDDFFDWEDVLLKPLEDQGIEVGIMTGVSWGWK